MSRPMTVELTEADWDEIERRYWRLRLVEALEARATLEAFRALTAHAEPAPFEFDGRTRCMRRLRRTA